MIPDFWSALALVLLGAFLTGAIAVVVEDWWSRRP
jgi:hypothetical protein